MLWGASAAAVPISSRVLDASGEPVAAGTAELRPLGADPFARAVSTAEVRGGRFVIAAPRRGPWRVTVRAPGQVPMEISLSPLLGPRVLPPLAFPRPVPGQVDVRSADGGPVPGAQVRVTPSPLLDPPRRGREWRPAPRAARTGDDGRAGIVTASGEDLDFSAWSAGRGWTSSAPPDAESAAMWRAVLVTTPARRWRVLG
ncbi:MAG: carboxypeptidase-like regulatory domain-containing protein, partial [Acidobacteriota bacterium]